MRTALRGFPPMKNGDSGTVFSVTPMSADAEQKTTRN